METKGWENINRPKGEILQIYQVDAFTSEPFKGNPAGVCLLDKKVDDNKMQSIAYEMNLSETSFILPNEDRRYQEADNFLLRWFTPEKEVPLCGHATLAASKVLFDVIHVHSDVIIYSTKSGRLSCRKGENGFVLDFPIDEYVCSNPPNELVKYIGINKPVNTVYGKNTKKLILHIESEEELLKINPDFEKLKSLIFENEIKGVAVTAKGRGRVDFISRYFNPWAGVNEDPVTGSVHTVLASYWGDLLNKKEMVAYQKSRRGGEIVLRLKEGGRLELIGDAIIVFKGEFYL